MPRGGPRPGAGRKPYSVEVYRREMERLLLACVSEEDWTLVVKAALTQAQNGEAAARQWLAERVMGKVKDVTTVEQTGEVKHVVEVTYTRRGAYQPGPAGAPPGATGDQG